MPTTPTGQLSGPLAALRELIALSPTFQELVGAADEVEAIEFVYGASDPDAVPPYAIVFETTGAKWDREVGAFGPSDLEFQIEAAIDPDEENERELFYQFANMAAAVADEVFELSNSVDGALYIREIMQSEAPRRTDKDREGDQYYWASFKVAVGLTA